MSDTIIATDGWVSVSAGGADTVRLQLETQAGDLVSVRLTREQTREVALHLLRRTPVSQSTMAQDVLAELAKYPPTQVWAAISAAAVKKQCIKYIAPRSNDPCDDPECPRCHPRGRGA